MNALLTPYFAAYAAAAYFGLVADLFAGKNLSVADEAALDSLSDAAV